MFSFVFGLAILAPDRQLQVVAFPGSAYSTPEHDAIFLHGRTPLTEHLITPVLVRAADGHFEGLCEMPGDMKALALSRPLHFGDYGGLGCARPDHHCGVDQRPEALAPTAAPCPARRCRGCATGPGLSGAGTVKTAPQRRRIILRVPLWLFGQASPAWSVHGPWTGRLICWG
ncbi:hypothetical protein JN531_006625 [Flagellatimonas centrodinii]|uniref:hypothetical protein n=1 Tax=Flagellatimonas centrodinii TaxID=2806210 RepID=UPI001FF00F08|nr:hypothetical protein [Flagellatimonas centrodinii]ULQ47960.1 hypothetical protein JN531_006625 [Flagellatimonas centrodinii]